MGLMTTTGLSYFTTLNAAASTSCTITTDTGYYPTTGTSNWWSAPNYAEAAQKQAALNQPFAPYAYGAPEKEKRDDMSTLYTVYMVYAEDRKNPIVKEASVLADTKEEAQIKCGLMKDVDAAWDMDYLTFICIARGEVKVKPKPKEVKQV